MAKKQRRVNIQGIGKTIQGGVLADIAKDFGRNVKANGQNKNHVVTALVAVLTAWTSRISETSYPAGRVAQTTGRRGLLAATDKVIRAALIKYLGSVDAIAVAGTRAVEERTAEPPEQRQQRTAG